MGTSEGSGTWSGQYIPKTLLPGTQYKARVCVTSVEGTGPYSSWLQFHTPGTVSSSNKISGAVVVMLICTIAWQGLIKPYLRQVTILTKHPQLYHVFPVVMN